MVDPSLPSLLNWGPLYLRSVGISRIQLPPGDQFVSERSDRKTYDDLFSLEMFVSLTTSAKAYNRRWVQRLLH